MFFYFNEENEQSAMLSQNIPIDNFKSAQNGRNKEISMPKGAFSTVKTSDKVSNLPIIKNDSFRYLLSEHIEKKFTLSDNNRSIVENHLALAEKNVSHTFLIQDNHEEVRQTIVTVQDREIILPHVEIKKNKKSTIGTIPTSQLIQSKSEFQEISSRGLIRGQEVKN